jgi:hypothetical protein
MRVVNEKAGTWRFAVAIENASGNEWGGLNWRADTNVWQCNNFGGTNNFVDTVGPLSGWAFIAYTRAGNPTATGYWSRMNGRFDKTLVNTLSIAALDHIQFGNDGAGEWVDGEFAHMRVWKRALSETELYTEMYSPFAVSKKDLDTDILGWNDRRNRAPGGEWTYTAVSGGTVVTPVSSDEIWFPKRITILAATGMTITNVAPSILYENLTNIIITGTGFGASQGTKTVYLDDKLQTVTAWAATSITITAVSPNLWANARLLQVRNT